MNPQRTRTTEIINVTGLSCFFLVLVQQVVQAGLG